MNNFIVSIVTYDEQNRSSINECISPDLSWLMGEICSMDKWAKPIISLSEKRDSFAENALDITGYNEMWHVQICIKGNWHEIINMEFPDEEIAVWESDQGFTCSKRNTLANRKDLKEIIAYYILNFSYSKKFKWDGLNF